MEANNLTYADRMQFARDAFAAGDMIAYVAACWSCEVARAETTLFRGRWSSSSWQWISLNLLQ